MPVETPGNATRRRPRRLAVIDAPRSRPGARGTPRLLAALMLIMVLLGTCWRIAWFATGRPLWGDEAFVAVSLLTRSLGGLWRPLDYWQVAPFGFMASQWGIIQWLGPNEWALRLLPFLAGIATIWLFWWFAPRVLDRWQALLAVSLFSASYFPVRYAGEIKPYSTDLLIAFGLTVLAWGLWQQPRSAWRWAAISALAAIGAWASYPAVFPAGAAVLVLGYRIWREDGIGPRLGWLAFGIALVGSWLAMMALYGVRHIQAAAMYSEMSTWQAAFPPWHQPWRLPLWLIRVHTGYLLAYPVGGSQFGSIATFVYASLGLWALGRRNRPLVALLLLPLALNFVAAALHRYPYGTSPRVSLYMAPAFCILAGTGLVEATKRLIPPRGIYPCLYAVMFGLAMLPFCGTIVALARPYRSYDDVQHRQIFQHLARQTQPADRWVLFNGIITWPKSPELMLAPWLQQEAEVRFYALQQARVPVQWMTGVSPQDPATFGPGRVWLIIDQSGYPRFPTVLANLLRMRLAIDHELCDRERFELPNHEVIEIERYDTKPR